MQWVDSKGQIRHLDAQGQQHTYDATQQTHNWLQDADYTARQINNAAQQQSGYRGMHQPQQIADLNIHGNWQAWQANRPAIEAGMQRQHMDRLAQEMPMAHWRKNWLPHSSMVDYMPNKFTLPRDPRDPMAVFKGLTSGGHLPGPQRSSYDRFLEVSSTPHGAGGYDPFSLQTNYQQFLTDRYTEQGLPDIVRRQAANPALARNFWEKSPSLTPTIP